MFVYKKISTFRMIIYLFSVITTLLFVYINMPSFYQKDNPEPFGFFSDVSSTSWLRYNKCALKSIDNSVSSSVDFYFGCYSSQLKGNVSSEIDYMHSGNCGHVKEFDTSLLNNNMPDYFIEFPFVIKDIGRSCRFRMNTTDNSFKEIELSDFFASHFNNINNTLAVEWGDTPSIAEFRFFADNVFKTTSFDKMSINYYISDQWMQRSNNKLLNNAPSSFVIELKIPKYYTIENLDQYELSDVTHRIPDLENFITIKLDIKKNKVLHLVIIDKNKELIKSMVNAIWTIFIAGIFLDFIIKKVNIQKK